MGEVADQQLINKVNRPEDVVNDQQDPIVVVMPADQQRIDPEEGVDDTRSSVVHDR